MVSARSPISTSYSRFIKSLGIVSSAPINIAITVTFFAQSADALEYTDCA